MYIDTHAHFDLTLEDNSLSEEFLFNEMKKNGISRAVQISIDIKSSLWAIDFIDRHRNDNIYISIGIHPSSPAGNDELNKFDDLLKEQVDRLNSGKVFGIGECGLDYFRMRQAKDMQIRSFEHQIDAAKKNNLPVIVHSRDAMDDTLKILRNKSVPLGIMHCFPGDSAASKKFLDLGFYISFAGNVTYNKASVLHDAASYVPLDRLLLETDAPFLTPVPFRGKKNMPHYIIHTYKFIAELRKEPLVKIAEAIQTNFLEITHNGTDPT